MKYCLFLSLFLLNVSAFGQSAGGSDTAMIRNMNMDQYKKLTASHKLIIVIFGATWCGPCKKVNPIMDRLATKYKLKLYHIDVDDNKDLAKAMTAIELPMIIFYRDGKALMTHLGENSEERFEKLLKEQL